MHEEGFCKTQKLIHEKEFYKQLGINLQKTWSKFIKKNSKKLGTKRDLTWWKNEEPSIGKEGCRDGKSFTIILANQID